MAGETILRGIYAQGYADDIQHFFNRTFKQALLGRDLRGNLSNGAWNKTLG